MKLVDAHIHLPAYEGQAGVVEAARATGTTLVSCTVNPGEALANLRLRERDPDTVRCFLGVHPSDVSEELPSRSLGELFPKADGIGEIGLDSKYSDTAKGSMQMNAFLDQLAAAERLGKPVEVHSRGSEGECLSLLTTFRLKSVLMHWFEGESHLQEVSSRGYFVSVGPAILYSKKVRRIAASVSGDRLLTESDGPVTYKAIGGPSGPGLIPSVLFSLSETRGVGFSEQARTIEENLRTFLGTR
jgi:TatD DNase family protein